MGWNNIGSLKGATGAAGRDGFSLVVPNFQVVAAYTLVLADANGLVDCAYATAVALTVPEHAAVAYPVGTVIAVAQGGVGPVTLVPASATVVLRKPYTLTTAKQESLLYLHQIAIDTWRVSGDST